MANFTCSMIVLAGGRSRRMSGITKSLLLFDGRTLLAHAVAAAPHAVERVVVGPQDLPVPEGVRLVLEDPPFGGPVAGIAAGLEELDRLGSRSDWILLTACDHPRAGAAAAALLAAAEVVVTDADLDGSEDVEFIVPTDSTGQEQILFALYRRGPLKRALVGVGGGRDVSVRRLISGLRRHVVVLPDGLLGDVDDLDSAVRAGIQFPPIHPPSEEDPPCPTTRTRT